MDAFCDFVLREEIDLDKSNPKLSREREREREHTTKGFWHVSRLDKLMNIIGLLGSYHQKWFAITFTGKSSKFYSAFTQSGAPMFCFPQKHRISLRFLNWKFKGQHVKGRNVRTSFNAFCKTLESGQALLFCIGPLHIFFGECKAVWTISAWHKKNKSIWVCTAKWCHKKHMFVSQLFVIFPRILGNPSQPLVKTCHRSEAKKFLQEESR